MTSDIFSLNEDDFKQEERKSSIQEFYAPNPQDAPDGVYKAIIRFLPNSNDVKKSIVRKVVHWLKEGESGFYADCPSSIGERSPLSDVYWKLKKSSSAYDQKQSELISRKEYYFSYVYIVKDFQKSELDGTVQVMRFPKTIRKMIQEELTPDAMQLEQGAEPTNVYDLFRGKDFLLKIGTKSGYRNYDSCEFTKQRSAIKINDVEMKPDADSKKAIMALYENQPNIEDNFGYKAWSPELTERVNSFIGMVTNGAGGAVTAVSTPTKAPTAQDTELAGQNLVTEAAPTAEPTVETSSSDDTSSELDAWLNGG